MFAAVKAAGLSKTCPRRPLPYSPPPTPVSDRLDARAVENLLKAKQGPTDRSPDLPRGRAKPNGEA